MRPPLVLRNGSGYVANKLAVTVLFSEGIVVLNGST